MLSFNLTHSLNTQANHLGFTMLRSEMPSGMCAKLRTVAASNNRVHMPWSLYYCLFAPHICMVLFFTHIPSVVNHTINATPPERLQQPSHLKPSNYYYDTIICLKQLRCTMIKIPNNCRQLVVLRPGVIQTKTSQRREVYFLMKKV